ncbi:UDP-3-O-(3-hydroxymyristoyl)glucosamine N-acyltransferase [bacterium]|nr:UDP-3-O-(3-hydroxymyristoyl)glucosamine N-acyltransferase [bacterium]
MSKEKLSFPLKVEEIAQIINGKVEGRKEIVINNVTGLKEAAEGDISFLSNPKYIEDLHTTRASAIIVSRDLKPINDKTIIRVKNPYFAFSQVLNIVFLSKQNYIAREVHKTCLIGKGVTLGKNVAVGAYCVIEDNVEIGENTIIYPGCYIGVGSKIGANSLIYANVTVREEVYIGNKVIIHCGAVIGNDGFGFVPFEEKHHKIPQIGKVVLEDEVEVGANTTIDRATCGVTHIGQGTKIDNLVQIAHNVKIGKNCFVVAQVGISGSTEIGNNVTLAGQAGLVGHISVGDKVVVGAQAGVTHSIPKHTVVSGYPARPHQKAKKIYALMQKLPDMYKEIQEIKKIIKKEQTQNFKEDN